MSDLGSYDSPTFLGQKDKYLVGLSLPELMLSMVIGLVWFLLTFMIPAGLVVRVLLAVPMTGLTMMFIFMRIFGMPIPVFLLLSLVRLFQHPSYEEGIDFLLQGSPEWLELQRQNVERGSRFRGLMRKGRRAVDSVPEARRAEVRAEMDRQVTETAVAAEGWARDAVRSLFAGR